MTRLTKQVIGDTIVTMTVMWLFFFLVGVAMETYQWLTQP